MTLKNKTIIITGSSRGIGREIALRCAQDGANLVIVGKSAEEGKLPGTIYSVAKEVESCGGQALALQVDVRSEEQIENMVTQTINRFGQIDVLINNAGAIQLTPLAQTPPKRLDLMLDINVRSTLLCSHFCIPHLKKNGGHIVSLSPPIDLSSKWFENHVAYTISKYGMSMATIGLAEELKSIPVSVNSMWPRTLIATAAVDMLMGDDGRQHSRTPAIMADAIYELVNTKPGQISGQHLLDEPFLRSQGYTDFDHYAVNPQNKLFTDLFIDPTT